MKKVSSIPSEFGAAIRRAERAGTADPIVVLSQAANLEEIERISTEEWITLYFYESNDSGSKCYFSALIPKEKVDTALSHDSWDLTIGDGLPGFSESYKSGNKITTYHRFISEPIEPLVFMRSFHGLKPRQFELLEEFRHFHNLYHDRRNDRYIRVDDRGEDEIVVEVSDGHIRAKTRCIRQFIAAKGLHLAIFFDHRPNAPAALSAAKAALPDRTVTGNGIRFSFHVGEVSGVTFSRLVGKKIISPPPIEQCRIWPFETEGAGQFVDFIIAVDSDGENVLHTADEQQLGNYFGKNPEAPHFLTPVWFRREVLRKYYDHPEKYSVEDGYLRCGGLWGLAIDNDLPEHVVVFLGDLGRLAYDEQLYWRSYNVTPVSDQSSETHFRRSYLAQFADPKAPDLVFKQKFVDLQEAWEHHFGWPLFRQLHDEDAHVIKQLRIPLTESMAEFDLQSLLLTKLLVDSLNDSRLAQELGGALPDEKSISKLERFLEEKKYPYKDRDSKLLRLLQSVRSSGAAHRKGEQFRKISEQLQLDDRSVLVAFRELLSQVNKMLSDLKIFFVPESDE